MRIFSKFVTGFAVALLALSHLAHAEDIDLFMNPPADASGALPNVLIILDNTANWSRADDGTTKFAFEKQALIQVLTQLKEEQDAGGAGFNVGLMMFSERGGGNSNPSGGYVRYAIKNDLQDLIDVVTALDEGADKGSEAEFAIAFHEAYLYFKGLDARAGDKLKTDLDAFVGGTPPTYRSPIVDICVSSYIIFISNGPPSQGENNTASGLLDGLGGKLASDPIALSPSGRQANWSDEYARFLNASGIKSYAIDVRPETTGQGPSNTALMKSIANQGDGAYYAVFNAAELQIALENVFSEIQAVNSVFAASALPVSVNVRGTYQNEVYMGVFRPDESASPRWFGNLKLFQFAVDSATNTVFLADKNGNPIQSPTTGFIRPTAVSFWTDDSDYWAYSPRGTPPTASDSPDGEVVEKGGVAQRQRVAFENEARKLYTCTTGCAAGSELSAHPFATTNAAVSAASLGVPASERDALIEWVRGEDNLSPPERAAGEVRPSIHGDVIHSRPAAVNFNRTGNESDVVVFYGANDGVFRAVRGGKTTAGGGNEIWGMVFPEHFGQLNRLRTNEPVINFPSDPDDPTANKSYFADGNVSVFTLDVNDDGRLNADEGDKVYLYVTMRRGGRFIYALDVSVPESPKFLWKRGCFGATPTCETGYGELGQSWSTAMVGKIRINVADEIVTKSVLFMGAGYDRAAEDASPQGAASMGRGMLVIDAETGDVLWQVGPSPSGADHNVTRADMVHSFPADLTLVDRNRNGVIERIYGVDTGGNIWRVDIEAIDPAAWSVSKIASLGGSGVNARKFLSRAEVVEGSDSRGDYDAVLVGSGDREKPFGSGVDNAFFMIKDRGDGEVATINDLYDATDNLIQDGDEAQQAIAAADLDDADGWFISLRTDEQVVGEAVAVSGTVFFPTNQPGGGSVNACVGNLGIARIYSVDYRDGRATIDRDGILGLTVADRSREVPGGGLPPSPTYALVDLDGQVFEAVIFGASTEPLGSAFGGRKRRYWSSEVD